MEISDADFVEKQRERAKLFKGVSYNARTGKFTAKVTIAGVQEHQGSYTNPEDAAEAYKNRRREMPVFRTLRDDSIRAAYEKFLETAQFEKKRLADFLVPGQIFTTADGQNYCLRRVIWRKPRGAKAVSGYYVWASRCRVCGEMFEATVLTNARTIRGISRNCKKHHGSKSGADARWPDPENWGVGPEVKQRAPITDTHAFYESCSQEEKDYYDEQYGPRVLNSGTELRSPERGKAAKRISLEILHEIRDARENGTVLGAQSRDNSDLV